MTLYLAICDRQRDSARATGACALLVYVSIYVNACVVRESYPGGRVQACTYGAMCSVRRRRKRTGSERKVDEREKEREREEKRRNERTRVERGGSVLSTHLTQ